MAELVDALDSKSSGYYGRGGSSPPSGTTYYPFSETYIYYLLFSLLGDEKSIPMGLIGKSRSYKKNLYYIHNYLYII